MATALAGKVNVLGIPLCLTSYKAVGDAVVSWSQQAKGRFICFANVHMLVEARRSPELHSALRQADLINPDGMPVVWTLRALGAHASRVYGPDCMQSLLQTCSDHGIPIGLYGGSESTLHKLQTIISSKWPRLSVPYQFSPPFREQTLAEQIAIIERIKASGARVLFVSLGCPKQELWIAKHRSTLPVVMLAVGAAFDFLAGTKPQAPRWMMRSGLEWLFRMATEPKRLLRRYLNSNPLFVYLAVQQILNTRLRGSPKGE